MAIYHEDKLFKLCDETSPTPIRRFTRRCYNTTLQRRTCLCSKTQCHKEQCCLSNVSTEQFPLTGACTRVHTSGKMKTSEAPVRVYGKGSALRLEYKFPCADLIKYKANYRRDQPGEYVMKP